MTFDRVLEGHLTGLSKIIWQVSRRSFEGGRLKDISRSLNGSCEGGGEFEARSTEEGAWRSFESNSMIIWWEASRSFVGHLEFISRSFDGPCECNLKDVWRSCHQEFQVVRRGPLQSYFNVVCWGRDGWRSYKIKGCLKVIRRAAATQGDVISNYSQTPLKLSLFGLFLGRVQSNFDPHDLVVGHANLGGFSTTYC